MTLGPAEPLDHLADDLDVLQLHGAPVLAARRLGAFARSDGSFETANLEYHVQPLSLDRFGDPLHGFPAITASVCNLRPTSRGTVEMRHPDPASPPVIRPNYLSTDEDRRVAADSIRVTRKIMAQPAMAKYSPQEYLPGALARDEDESGLIEAAGNIGTTAIIGAVLSSVIGLIEKKMA